MPSTGVPKYLQPGSYGPGVAAFQDEISLLFRKMGLPDITEETWRAERVVGFYGPATAAVLTTLQVKLKITPDGCCGPETRTKLHIDCNLNIDALLARNTSLGPTFMMQPDGVFEIYGL